MGKEGRVEGVHGSDKKVRRCFARLKDVCSFASEINHDVLSTDIVRRHEKDTIGHPWILGVARVASGNVTETPDQHNERPTMTRVALEFSRPERNLLQLYYWKPVKERHC